MQYSKSCVRRGLDYERKVFDLLIDMKNVCDLVDVWMWSYIPVEHLYLSGYMDTYNAKMFARHRHAKYINPYCDRGVDIMTRNLKGMYTFVQCKDVRVLASRKLGTFYDTVADARSLRGDAVRGSIWFSGTIDRGLHARLRGLSFHGINLVHYDGSKHCRTKLMKSLLL